MSEGEQLRDARISGIVVIKSPNLTEPLLGEIAQREIGRILLRFRKGKRIACFGGSCCRRFFPFLLRGAVLKRMNLLRRRCCGPGPGFRFVSMNFRRNRRSRLSLSAGGHRKRRKHDQEYSYYLQCFLQVSIHNSYPVHCDSCAP